MHDLPSTKIWFSHRISYGETDTMGVLYYAEYFHIFERSRSEYIRSKGMSYKDIENKSIFFPVRKAECRYRKPSRYDDLIWVQASIAVWSKASFTFIYEIFNEDKCILLATGLTQHAVVNENGRPIASPAWLKDLLK